MMSFSAGLICAMTWVWYLLLNYYNVSIDIYSYTKINISKRRKFLLSKYWNQKKILASLLEIYKTQRETCERFSRIKFFKNKTIIVKAFENIFSLSE